MNACQHCGQISMSDDGCDCTFAVARRKIDDLFDENEAASIPEHYGFFQLLYGTCDIFAAGGLAKAVLQMNDTTTITFQVKNHLLMVERKDTEKKTEAISI